MRHLDYFGFTYWSDHKLGTGAQFVVTPVSKPEVIQMAHQYEKPILSGAMTPSEILQAYEWGTDVVKLFPAANFGLSYFKAVKAPMPHIPIMPTGGITAVIPPVGIMGM